MNRIRASRSKVPPAKVVAVGVVLALFFFLQICVSWIMFSRKEESMGSATPSAPMAQAPPVASALPETMPPIGPQSSEGIPAPETVNPAPIPGSTPAPLPASASPLPEPKPVPQVSVHHFENGVPVAYEDSHQ